MERILAFEDNVLANKDLIKQQLRAEFGPIVLATGAKPHLYFICSMSGAPRNNEVNRERNKQSKKCGKINCLRLLN